MQFVRNQFLSFIFTYYEVWFPKSLELIACKSRFVDLPNRNLHNIAAYFESRLSRIFSVNLINYFAVLYGILQIRLWVIFSWRLSLQYDGLEECDNILTLVSKLFEIETSVQILCSWLISRENVPELHYNSLKVDNEPIAMMEVRSSGKALDWDRPNKLLAPNKGSGIEHQMFWHFT